VGPFDVRGLYVQALRRPQAGHVADLPDWQKETDADIFEAVEDASK